MSNIQIANAVLEMNDAKISCKVLITIARSHDPTNKTNLCLRAFTKCFALHRKVYMRTSKLLDLECEMEIVLRELTLKFSSSVSD